MNTQVDLEIETPTPLEEIKRADRPPPQIYPPEVIGVTITEADVKTAGRYSDANGCLLCTALSRMGFKGVTTGGFPSGLLHINNFLYAYELADECELSPLLNNPVDPLQKHYNYSKEKPYYNKSAVGLTLTFIRKQ